MTQAPCSNTNINETNINQTNPILVQAVSISKFQMHCNYLVVVLGYDDEDDDD